MVGDGQVLAGIDIVLGGVSAAVIVTRVSIVMAAVFFPVAFTGLLVHGLIEDVALVGAGILPAGPFIIDIHQPIAAVGLTTRTVSGDVDAVTGRADVFAAI